MAYYSPQASFNKGEISPLLGSRADIDFWQTSLKECTNFQVLVQGGIRRRSGTIFVTEVADSSQRSRLLPFVFSSEQAYVLDFNGGGTIRFVADRAYLVSGASPYSISHSYAEDDIARINFAQANDVMYLAHKSYAPRKIARLGDIDWSNDLVEYKDGPYLDLSTEGTRLTPASRASLTPVMTSATTPSGSVTASADAGAGLEAWRAFDGSTSSRYATASLSGFLAYEPASPAVVDGYSLTNPFGTTSSVTGMVGSWTFDGYDGSNWIVLDSRQAEADWSGGETRYYNFDNDVAYEAYRLSWSANNGNEDITVIGEMTLHVAAESQSAFNLTASSTAGINGGSGFQTSDVGRLIRILGTDNRWRWARIESRSSATVVQIKLFDQALPNTNPITSWQLGSWSDESGWPGAVTIYDERLMWARTDAQPVSVFGSKQSIFDDYGVSDPAVETDGISLTILSSNMNEILWLADDEDLITGTSRQIRSIGPADFTKAFSAINLTQKKGPTSGAYYLQPITIGGVVLYVGEGGRKVRELILGDQNRYVAPDLSAVAEHMLKSGIVEWAFSENPDPTIYAVTGNGDLIAVTYDRDQKVVGFARHQIAGGHVESVAAIPGVVAGEDDIYLVVRRTIDGQTKRYIEVLESPFDGEEDTLDDAFFVDCGLSYSGTEITTATGLDHLEGETVVALADGGVVEDLVVSGGSVTLPYAASTIAIGLPYESRAVTLPVAGPQQDGSLFGRRINIIMPKVDVLKSGSLEVGPLGSDDWTPEPTEAIFRRHDELFGSPVELVTGFQEAEIEGSWADGDGCVVMETDQPLPLLIRSVVFQLENEP